jgi:hypothetical protein
MHLSGYLAAPNAAIFLALDHTMRYLHLYCHIHISYPRRPLSKKALGMHWYKGTAESIPQEYGVGLINSNDADHARDIRDRRSISSSHNILSGVVVAWRCKKQVISTLHSLGS